MTRNKVLAALGAFLAVATGWLGATKVAVDLKAPSRVEAPSSPSPVLTGFNYLDMRISHVKEYAEKLVGDSRLQADKMNEERRAQAIDIKTDLNAALARLTLVVDRQNDKLDLYNEGLQELLRRIPKKREVSKLLKFKNYE